MVEKNKNLYATTAIWRRSLLYVGFLFAFSIALTAYFTTNSFGTIIIVDWPIYLFFFLFALFTDFKGFPHPNFGYVSFDRVVQISSILVLGPIPAAIINGLASFLFPLLSNYLGGNKKAITVAVFNNSAMMVLMMLVGVLFEYFGGEIPLIDLDLKQLLMVCVLLIVIQLTNSFCMRILIKVRQQKIEKYFSVFTTTVEISSGFVGVFFALVFNQMNLASILLFVIIMVVVIYVINQFALMRHQLEKIVQQRTQELEFHASHDEMTGLVNRRYINAHIKAVLGNKDIDNSGVFIAFADVDNFKSINDTYSHDSGDKVLQQIGKIFQQFCQQRLIIARFGGEEFLMCFTETDAQSVLETCEQIRKDIKSLDMSHIEDNLKVTISIGIAHAHVNSLHKTLISRADVNLYQAKENGKNQTIY